MTLAEEVREKALQLKQDFVDVKAAGYAEGYPNGEQSGFANGFEHGKTEGYNNGYTEGKDEGYTEGKTDGYNEGYADGLANGGGGSRAVDLFPYMTGAPVFTNADMTDITEDITLHLEGVNGLASSFSGVKFGCKKLTVYISNKCLSLFRAFRMGNSLEELELVGATSQINNYNSAFQERTTIKRILGNFDFSSATNVGNMFYRADALEEFYPVANTIKISMSFADSPNLIPACKQAIIDGLADLTGQTTQTITFHKDVVLTKDQEDEITNKNWTLAQ